MTAMNGFLEPGPNGPRMTEAQLLLSTRVVYAITSQSDGDVSVSTPAQAMLAALDAYPVDRSCFTCKHGMTRTGDESPIYCHAHLRAIPAAFVENDDADNPCPKREDS